MGITSKTTKVKLMGKSIALYNSMGYIGSAKDIIDVNVEDLPPHSNAYVDVQCDVCGKIYDTPIRYSWYTAQTEKYGILYCYECKSKKSKITCLSKYGVDNPMKCQDIKDILEKSVFEKYGTHHVWEKPEVRIKIRNTMIERYGVENAFQKPEIRTKHNKSLHSEGYISCSKNQKYLCELYDGILNYRISKYNMDIYFEKERICCEYSGTGHDLSVRIGKTSEEDFKNKEKTRTDFLINNNIKVFEIIHKENKLPSDDVLLSIKDNCINLLHNNLSYIKVNIDGEILESR